VFNFPFSIIIAYSILSLECKPNHCTAYGAGRRKTPQRAFQCSTPHKYLIGNTGTNLGIGWGIVLFALGMVEIALDVVVSLALICVGLYGPSQRTSCS
jgi:hypothetical protein